MAEQQLGGIAVNARTIQIAGDIVAIGHVVRLRVIQYHDTPGLSPLRRTIVNGFVVAAGTGLFVMFVEAFLSAGFGGEVELTPVGPLLLSLGLIGAAGVLLYSHLGPYRWLLTIELASGNFTILTAPEPGSLETLKWDVARIIEDPPDQPTTFAVSGDVYTVDLRNSRGVQLGNANTQSNVTAPAPV